MQETFAGVFNTGSDFATDGSQFDHLFADGETISIGVLDGRVMHTPGHTPASVTCVFGDAAFVGDTLFMPDFGTARCDFPGGDAKALFASIHKVLALPPETRLFMRHDYIPNGRDVLWETTVAAEKAENLHVRDGVDETEFVAMRTARDAKLDMPGMILPVFRSICGPATCHRLKPTAFPISNCPSMRYERRRVSSFNKRGISVESQGFKDMIASANAVIDSVSVHDALPLASDDGVVFVDVLEAAERVQGTIPGSIHAPRGFLEFIADPQGPMHKPELASGKRIVVFSASGGRSALATKTMVDMGLQNVANMAGGIAAWREAGGAIGAE